MRRRQKKTGGDAWPERCNFCQQGLKLDVRKRQTHFPGDDATTCKVAFFEALERLIACRVLPSEADYFLVAPSNHQWTECPGWQRV